MTFSSGTPATGLAGYSVCMVIKEQNEDAGIWLGGFYGDNRIIDNDRFQVWSN
jgi:hypothetical protein